MYAPIWYLPFRRNRGVMMAMLNLSSWWAAGLLVGALLVSGCGKRETAVEEGIRTRTLLVGNSAEPASLDPHVFVAATDMRVAAALFEGLTVLDEASARPLPGGAERWEVSPDGLTYTFHLRANGKWSDGEPVTAGDFAYAFRRILTPAFGAPYSYMLWPIKNAEAFNAGKITDFAAVGVTVVDARTLRLTLERPTAYLLSLAAHGTWFPVPRRTLEKFGKGESRDNTWSRPGNLVGNGPFSLSEWKSNSVITVTKNPHYWGAAENQIERVRFFPIEQSDSEELSFRAGQLHVTAAVPASKVPVYRQKSPELLRINPLLNVSYICFNTTKPPFNDARVRQALALAFDRKAISARVFESVAPAAYNAVAPNSGGYLLPPGQVTDVAKARALLAEAGFPGGQGLPEFPLIVMNDEKSSKIGEALQSMWLKELGVRVSVERLEQKTLFQTQQSLNYTIGLLGWTADYADPYSFLEIFRGGNGNNWTGWASAQFDALLDEASGATQPEKRFALLQQAETVLLEAAPLAPIVYGARAYLVHPAVRNWVPAPLGLHRYQTIRLEK